MADGQVVSRNVYDGFDHVVSPNTGGSGTMKSAKFTFDPLDRTASKTADGRTTTFNYLGLSGSRWGWRPPRWRSPREGRGVDGGRPAAVRGGGAGAAAAGPADRRRGDDRAVARHQGRAAALRPPEPERLGPRFRDPRLQVPARDGLFVLAAQLRQSGTFLWNDPDAGLACAALTDRAFRPWRSRRGRCSRTPCWRNRAH